MNICVLYFNFYNWQLRIFVLKGKNNLSVRALPASTRVHNLTAPRDIILNIKYTSNISTRC